MKSTSIAVGFLAAMFSITSMAATPPVTRAQVDLSPTANNTAIGAVTFYQFADGVRVVADLSGLKPGSHGFHIHQWGDCSAPDASSAGGHFNPTNEQHGAPDAAHHHVGDFGNVVADANGKAHYEIVSKTIMLNGPNSIIGRSMIVHADSDDLHTQPTGNSGARVACGVIGVINPFPEKGTQ